MLYSCSFVIHLYIFLRFSTQNANIMHTRNIKVLCRGSVVWTQTTDLITLFPPDKGSMDQLPSLRFTFHNTSSSVTPFYSVYLSLHIIISQTHWTEGRIDVLPTVVSRPVDQPQQQYSGLQGAYDPAAGRSRSERGQRCWDGTDGSMGPQQGAPRPFCGTSPLRRLAEAP